MGRVWKAAAVGVLAVAATQVAGAPVSAGGDGFGTVKGRVTDKTTGLPVVSACVTIVADDTLMTAFTGVDGRYQIAGVPVGAWKMFSSDCNLDDGIDHQPEQFRNIEGLGRPGFEPVNILDDAPTTQLNFTPSRGGRLTVTVKEDGGGPLSGIFVCPEYNNLQAQNTFCSSTDDNGEVTLIGVQAKNKVVVFDLNGVYATEYYKNKLDHASANTVQVPIDGSAGITAKINLAAQGPGTALAYTPVLAPEG